MIKAKVNDSEFDVEVLSSEKVMVNGKQSFLDVITLSDSKKHVLIENKSYSIEQVDFDTEKKIATLKVNNKTYRVALKDKYDILLKELGMANMAAKVVKEIKAPMPGLVVSIEVEKGQEVKVGQPVIILEAMKMENVLKSPIDGIVKSIKAVKSTTVDKNTILIEFE